MKKSARLWKISLLLTLVFAAASEKSLAMDGPRPEGDGRWDFIATSEIFQANANYKKDSAEFVSLPSGSSYMNYEFDFGMHYNATPNLGFFGSLGIAGAESSGNGIKRTNSIISGLNLGSDFVMVRGNSYKLIPSFSVRVPFSKIDPNEDAVLASEGTMDVLTQIALEMKWGSIIPIFKTGFLYRNDGRASLLTYSAGADWKFSSWSLGGGLEGYTPVIKDEFSGQPTKRDTVLARNGFAKRFYTIDPQLLEAQVWTRFGRQTILSVGVGTTLTGSNTAAGTSLLATFEMPIFGDTTYRPTPTRTDRKRTDIDQFEEATEDGVDQHYFQVKPVPSPVPPTPEQERARLRKELDQTEMQIELKSNKPTKKKSSKKSQRRNR